MLLEICFLGVQVTSWPPCWMLLTKYFPFYNENVIQMAIVLSLPVPWLHVTDCKKETYFINFNQDGGRDVTCKPAIVIF